MRPHFFIGRPRHGLAAVMMAASMAAQAAPPSLPTGSIAPGTHAMLEDPFSAPPRESALLAVRSGDGQLRVWFFPKVDGELRLPADERWSPGPTCDRLDVDFRAQAILCAKSLLPAQVLARYRWALDGSAATPFVPPLIKVPGHEQAGRFLIIP